MKPTLTALLLIAALYGCAGYVPGRQSYWDSQVKELCEKDGGITIFEKIELSEDDYKRLGGMPGGIPIPHVSSKRTDYPYFYEVFDFTIRESNPVVVRTETIVKRRADGKVLGRSIQYFRRGGDIPTGLANDSSFLCPDKIQLTGEIFRVKGAFK